MSHLDTIETVDANCLGIKGFGDPRREAVFDVHQLGVKRIRI